MTLRLRCVCAPVLCAVGRIPEKLLLLWVRDAAQAIAHLHSQSPPIAHRDIKPENLLLAVDGTVKLCDFGSCSRRAGVYDTSAVRVWRWRSCRLARPCWSCRQRSVAVHTRGACDCA